MLSLAKTMLCLAGSIAISLWKDRRGASLLEYSLLIGIIVALTVTLVTAVGVWVTGRWSTLCSALTGSANCVPPG
jgi:pilus assembly protein Flp/PilA